MAKKHSQTERELGVINIVSLMIKRPVNWVKIGNISNVMRREKRKIEILLHRSSDALDDSFFI